MSKDIVPVWLYIIMGLFAAMLCSAGAVLLLGIIGPYYDLPFVEQTLVGTVPIGVALLLFFGLRGLARARCRGTGAKRFALDAAIVLFVAVLWTNGMRLVFYESGVDFNIRLLQRTIVGVTLLGVTLSLFYGFGALARKLLSLKRQQ